MNLKNLTNEPKLENEINDWISLSKGDLILIPECFTLRKKNLLNQLQTELK